MRPHGTTWQRRVEHSPRSSLGFSFDGGAETKQTLQLHENLDDLLEICYTITNGPAQGTTVHEYLRKEEEPSLDFESVQVMSPRSPRATGSGETPG